MEIRCVKCISRQDQTCDFEGDWVFDEEGALVGAKSVEDCPEFHIAPEFVCNEIMLRVMDIDPTDFRYVKVTEGRPREDINDSPHAVMFIISIVTHKNHPVPDRVKLAHEVTQALQELNDEEFHIHEAEFIVNIIYADGVKPMELMNLESEEEKKQILDLETTGLQSMRWQSELPNQANGPSRECPLCNTAMSKTCPNCGWEEEETDESWRESI